MVLESKIGDRERQRWIYDVDGNLSMASLQSVEESRNIGNSLLGSDERNVVDMRFGGGWINLQRISMMRTKCCFEKVKSHCKPTHGVGIMQMLRSWLSGRSGHSTRSTGLSDTSPMDEVDFCDCTNVTVLKLVRVRLKALDLSALRQLRSLQYHFGREFYANASDLYFVRAGEVRGLRRLSNLVVLLLHGIRGCSSFIEEIAGLTNLQILELSLGSREINKYPNLKRLCSLQELILRCFRIKANNILGLDIGRMRHLRFLELSWCSFSKCPGLVTLEVLELRGCRNLKELPNLQRLTRLWKLNISWCKSISSLSGVGALVALEELDASECCKLSGSLDLSSSYTCKN